MSCLFSGGDVNIELINIETEFCFPVRPLDMPAMNLLSILLATSHLLNVREGMVV